MFSKIFFLFTLIFTQINALSRTYILLQGTEENNATSSRLRRESSEEEKSKKLDGQTNSMDFVQMSRPIVGQAPADPCLLKCKDDYLLYTEPGNANPMPSWRMDSAIGSPLHALIETVSATNSLDRMTMECNHQKDFLICLKRCGKSAARQILVDGQEAMKTVCQSFKKDKEFLHYVLPCLAKNGNRIGKSCQLHLSLMENDIYEAIQNRLIADQNKEGLIEGENGEKEEEVEDGFRRLCRAMSSYSDCHLKTVAHLCHRRAIPFFVRLNNKSSGSLLKMLIDWFDRPALNPDWLECEHWDPQKLLANESNGMGKSSQNIGRQILTFLFAILYIILEEYACLWFTRF